MKYIYCKKSITPCKYLPFEFENPHKNLYSHSFYLWLAAALPWRVLSQQHNNNNITRILWSCLYMCAICDYNSEFLPCFRKQPPYLSTAIKRNPWLFLQNSEQKHKIHPPSHIHTRPIAIGLNWTLTLYTWSTYTMLRYTANDNILITYSENHR